MVKISQAELDQLKMLSDFSRFSQSFASRGFRSFVDAVEVQHEALPDLAPKDSIGSFQADNSGRAVFERDSGRIMDEFG